MREYKRIPKISNSAKRLIAIEALRYPDMPRDDLAQVIKEKIQNMGELQPLKMYRLWLIIISFKHIRCVVSGEWNLGMMMGCLPSLNRRQRRGKPEAPMVGGIGFIA